jgi:phage tail P2-like protein
VDLLPWLAWTLSVETWNSNWPEKTKRAVISGAVESARKKGTKQSVEDALAALGASSVMVEWFEKSPAGAPHTFEINLVAADASLEMQAAMVAEIERTKPLRSHYSLNYGVAVTGGINLSGVLRPVVFTRLDGISTF